jgi:hypothetical protein
MSRLTLARGARNRINNGALSGSGRPSSGAGVNGNTYYRTDTGWTYTKTAGTWAVSSVPINTGSKVLPFAASEGYYVSPYLANAPGGNIHGNLMTHGKASEILQKVSLLDATPSLTYGQDGTSNFSVLASPTNGAKKAHRFRGQKADANTAGGIPRTEIRFGDTQLGDYDGGNLNLVPNEWRAFAFSVLIPAGFKSTIFNLSGYSVATTGESGGVLLWQDHDVGWNITPNMVLAAVPSWFRCNPNNGTAPDGDSATGAGTGVPTLSNGLPPKLVFYTTGALAGWTLNDALAAQRGVVIELDFTTDQWFHFAGRFKQWHSTLVGPGSPRNELWMAKGSAAPTKVVDNSFRNGFDPAQPGIRPNAPHYGMYSFKHVDSWAGAATEVQVWFGDSYMSVANFQPTDADCLDAIAVLQARHQ